ncbi:type II secretion system F family protein [Trichlorobacter ammonificans]|uniref:General secretion pathway protein F n=1 Tax=Trichlorobacter ammonificans TaxID=2916410 RepID=A0ABM9DDA7_9BACT|nr:type II secretion system F family protein [Trichlorobacter ammonificans]CAH2032355.1 General secretion pathway protein F [Trichlorobacter ammonificans]
MTTYRYQAVDGDGVRQQGLIKAESEEVVAQDLAARGYLVLSIQESAGLLDGLMRRFAQQKVRRMDIIELANSLSVMMGAGLPITTSLADIISATPNPTLRNILGNIKQEIEQGSTFSDALDRRGAVFPDIFTRLVRVGEETGRFEKSLADVAEHLQRVEDLTAAIKKALIYPAFAIVTTLGALIFWLVFVLPQIIGTIKGMGVKLPLLTRILMGASTVTQQFWYLAPLVVAAAYGGFRLLKRSEQGLYLIDAAKLRLPIYKLIEYNRLLAVFAEQMRILIVAGLTVDRTLGIVSSVVHNAVFKKAFDQIREDITYGSTIADALRKHPVFPVMVVRLVGIGESSGSLDNQFSFLATHYLKKLDEISDKLGKIIEPVVIGFIGVMFAVIIMGLLLPVYDLISAVGKG